nr:molybdenum cofactor guanylyltransferase [Ardenticatena sp.]
MARESLSAAVLAGGQSRRMGRDKTLLRLHGEPLIARVVRRLHALTDDVLVVTNEPQKYAPLHLPARFVADVGGPGQGPLAGIAAALQAARAERVAIVAADMPFLNVALLRFLADYAPEADVVVPVIEADRAETLHAIYGRGALPAVMQALQAGRRRVVAFFDNVRVVRVPADVLRPLDPDLRSFLNANTPEEWARVLLLANTSSK